MNHAAGNGRFSDIVSSAAELHEVVGQPSHRVQQKVIDRIDEHCRQFIERSPFLVIGSSDGAGNVDLSPKGDPAGFVAILDERTIAIPDRPGNRRLDTFHNILANPSVGLIFLVPGKRETLRVSGRAAIVRDPVLRERLAVNGKVPALALVVTVERAFFHCAKCMIRSRLWEPDHWPELEGLAPLAEILVAHTKLGDSIADMQAMIDRSAREQLY